MEPLLYRLPDDVLARTLSCLDAVTLLSVSQTSTNMRVAVDSDTVWRPLLWRHHRQILLILFDGRIPRLPQNLSRKQQYFLFATSWKRLAMQDSGRILLKIDGYASGGTLGTFGVYDATIYAPSHPGLEFIVEDAAQEEDSSATFDAAAHSTRGKAILRSLAVPGLEAITPDVEVAQLAAVRRRARRRWYVARLLRWGPPTALLLVALVLARPHIEGLCARLAEAMPQPVAPWLGACLTTGLSVYEWTAQGVGALALVLLATTLHSLGWGVVSGFFADLFSTPTALCSLALAPLAIALGKHCHARAHARRVHDGTTRLPTVAEHGHGDKRVASTAESAVSD